MPNEGLVTNMRIISLFLCACFLVLFPSSPSVNLPNEPEKPQAAEEILFGTPEIDGVLDEIYLESYCYVLPKGENLNYAPSREDAEIMMENTAGTVYYLYDDTYLYACAVICDETLMSRGEKWRFETTWPWNDDGAELYYAFSSDHMFAIHTDAFGIRSVVDEKIWGTNHSTAKKYHDTPKEDYATAIVSNNIYIIEIRVELDEGMGAGDTIGLFLEIDDRYSETGTGALFPANRDPMNNAYLVKLSVQEAIVSETEDTTEQIKSVAKDLHAFTQTMAKTFKKRLY